MPNESETGISHYSIAWFQIYNVLGSFQIPSEFFVLYYRVIFRIKPFILVVALHEQAQKQTSRNFSLLHFHNGS